MEYRSFLFKLVLEQAILIVVIIGSYNNASIIIVHVFLVDSANFFSGWFASRF